MAGENSYADIPEFFPAPSSGMTAWKMSVEISFVMVNSKAFKIEMYLKVESGRLSAALFV